MRVQNLVFGFALAAAAATIVACGGGGGSTSGGGGGGVVPVVTPTPNTISGTAVDFTAGTALVGFTVTVGSLPTATTCNAAQTASSMPCGVPASPLPPVTTSATGAFSVTVPTTGTYMLTIAKDGTYATLHRNVAALAGATALGTLKITALSSDEQAWIVDVNHQRATVSSPASFGNLVVDEYAEEQARAEAAAIVSGAAPYGDATEAVYAANYSATVGAMYSVATVADLVPAASGYVQADANWMAEKSNCPTGNWQTCAVAENTGHYINLSNTDSVWAGLGESTTSFVYSTFGSQWAYAGLFIENVGSAGPASIRRVSPLQPK